MAINTGYKQFPEFGIRKDPETVYTRFVKYAVQFKNNHFSESIQRYRQGAATIAVLRFDG